LGHRVPNPGTRNQRGYERLRIESSTADVNPLFMRFYMHEASAWSSTIASLADRPHA
jgi:hypothetical protein